MEADKKKKKSILPDDVIMDILLLLPIKSLMRFKCVNKPWLQLLTNDPQFVQLYQYQLNKNPIMLALCLDRHKDETCNKSAVELTACGKALELELPFCRGNSTSTSKSYKIYGICRGLIWVSFENVKSMYLWNQLTNDYIQIPSSPRPIHTFYSDTCDKSITNFGFCYLQDTNQYKAISFVDCERAASYDEYGCYEGSHVSVYTLGTDSSWRNLRNINYHHFCMDCVAPLVNGALHWIAYTGWLCLDNERIVTFDIKDEVFGEIPHPSYANVNYHTYSNGKVGVLGGLLCILCQTRIEDENVQVWVMLEYGVASSWTKQFTIGRTNIGSFIYLQPIHVANNGDILIKKTEESNSEFILYNPKTFSVRKYKEFRFECYDAYIYTLSLISPNVILGSNSEIKRERKVTGRKGTPK